MIAIYVKHLKPKINYFKNLIHYFTNDVQIYEHEHNKTMSTPATAQMLSTMLYYKRFFPYYVSNILAGLDTDGKGVVYRYDPVGHCEKGAQVAGGSSGALLQPLLDNQVPLYS